MITNAQLALQAACSLPNPHHTSINARKEQVLTIASEFLAWLNDNSLPVSSRPLQYILDDPDSPLTGKQKDKLLAWYETKDPEPIEDAA